MNSYTFGTLCVLAKVLPIWAIIPYIRQGFPYGLSFPMETSAIRTWIAIPYTDGWAPHRSCHSTNGIPIWPAIGYGEPTDKGCHPH